MARLCMGKKREKVSSGWRKKERRKEGADES
jgi:hypothetical protein